MPVKTTPKPKQLEPLDPDISAAWEMGVRRARAKTANTAFSMHEGPLADMPVNDQALHVMTAAINLIMLPEDWSRSEACKAGRDAIFSAAPRQPQAAPAPAATSGALSPAAAPAVAGTTRARVSSTLNAAAALAARGVTGAQTNQFTAGSSTTTPTERESRAHGKSQSTAAPSRSTTAQAGRTAGGSSSSTSRSSSSAGGSSSSAPAGAPAVGSSGVGQAHGAGQPGLSSFKPHALWLKSDVVRDALDNLCWATEQDMLLEVREMGLVAVVVFKWHTTLRVS